MKTIRFVVDFFPDGRYMLLLETNRNYRNVRLEPDGRITICFTDDDEKTLKKLPRLYRDFDGLNNEYLFMRDKQRILKNRHVEK